MKRIAVILAAIIFVVSNGIAQNSDTTKIKMGNKKIIIIEEIEESTEKLEKAKAEFDEKSAQLQREMDSLAQLQSNPSISESEMKELENSVKELEAQLRALEEGKVDVDIELRTLEDEMRKHENGNENHRNHSENHSEDMDFDFDFDFDHEDANKDSKKKKRRSFEAHYAGFDFGLNNLLNSENKMEFPNGYENMELNFSKSWTLAVNPIEHSIVIIPRLLGLVTGAGLEWNNYHFDNNINLMESESKQIFAVTETEKEYYKNSLNVFHVNVPLMLELHVGEGLNLGVGVYGGVRLGAKTKQFYKENDNKFKLKNKDDYQISPYNYGVTVRFGMKDYQLFANYSLMPFFKENRGPEMYPISVGITFPSF